MELLAPAGNLDKLQTAVRFGADAVYCGAGNFSLRAPETAFSLDDLSEGVAFAHARNCRVYLAMNILAFDEDLAEMIVYLREAVQIGIDAVIVSDPGVIACINQLGLTVRIHLSTQASTMNSESVRFWKEQGVVRIILARELNLDRIRVIKDKVPQIELEAFVHGAMCIAYSGRCLLSSFMTGRSANRGHCAQPCRWEYQLREVVSGEEQIIQEDGRGTYVLNSRDLCMIEHIPALAAAGVDSLKIEGRMKSAYYVAMVARVYRAALDRFYSCPEGYKVDPTWLDELNNLSHRPYTTGFYLPGENAEREYTASSAYLGGHDFVATVEAYDPNENSLCLKARNRFAVNEHLEIIDPERADIVKLRVKRIVDMRTGEDLPAAHNSYLVTIYPDGNRLGEINRHSFVRKAKI